MARKPVMRPKPEVVSPPAPRTVAQADAGLATPRSSDQTPPYPITDWASI